MPREPHSVPAEPPEVGLDLDPEIAARHKADRLRKYKTETVPKLRFVGYGLMATMVPLHNFFFTGDAGWRIFGNLLALGMLFAMLSWGLVYRFHDRTWRGVGVDDLSLCVDILLISILVWFTGIDQSVLFPLYLFRVGDQTQTTFRRALFFAHLVILFFLGTIAFAAWAGHPVSWGREATKAWLLYITAFYISLSGREAERMRRKVHDAIQMTRDFNQRLVSQAEKLLSQTEELRTAKEVAEMATRRAEVASQTKSAFLASTSHDLRTPLNAILLYSELLREDAEAEGRQEAVQDLKKIHGAGQHLLQLLNDLLDLAKVEAGKMTFFLELLSVSDLVAEIQDLAIPLVAQKGNTLKLEVDPGIGTLVADATRFRQILLNLLSNAAKFTENGDITFSLRKESVEGIDWVIATVRDTGLGMSPDQVGKLFQEFVQAEDSTTKKFGGTGLGLVLCQRLSTLMGGNIQVTSELGKGSAFAVRLPWRQSLGNAAENPKAIARPSRLGNRVLIIDDDEAIRQALRKAFTQEGYEVLEAENGEEGLAMAREFHPSIITLDVVMPGIDGWTVLRTLKSEPELAAIPVILITMADDRSQGFALGAAEYLPKPIDPKRFQEVLKRFAPEAGSLLLVEDDKAQRVAMSRVLEGAGWHVQTAVHGLDALRILEGGLLPDLILLDLLMPEMDGFEFMDVLHQRGIGQKIPVVVITAEDLGEEPRNRLTQRGVQEVLPKGAYPKDKLAEIVRDLALRLPAGA